MGAWTGMTNRLQDDARSPGLPIIRTSTPVIT